MKTYNPDELKAILDSHVEWLNGSGGQRADLYGANLSNTDLHNTDLHNTDVRYADLTGANLRGVDLSGANLYGANLHGAVLTGADLRDVIGNGREVKSLRVEPWHVVYTKDIVAIGCQQHSKSDWLEFTDDQISEMSPRALAWWKEWKPKLIEMGIF